MVSQDRVRRLTWAIKTDRTKRVREARDEAKKEIEAYKAQKEAEFKKFEAEVWCFYAPLPPLIPFPFHSPSLSPTSCYSPLNFQTTAC